MVKSRNLVEITDWNECRIALVQKFMVEEICHKYLRVPQHNQSITQSYLFFPFRFCFDCLVILVNVRKDIIFMCSKEKKTYYSPVFSLDSSKCSINWGNSTPKLRTNPVLIAPQIAEEIHTTQDQQQSEWCLPRKNQHSFPSISLAFFWTHMCVACDFYSRQKNVIMATQSPLANSNFILADHIWLMMINWPSCFPPHFWRFVPISTVRAKIITY